MADSSSSAIPIGRPADPNAPGAPTSWYELESSSSDPAPEGSMPRDEESDDDSVFRAVARNPDILAVVAVAGPGPDLAPVPAAAPAPVPKAAAAKAKAKGKGKGGRGRVAAPGPKAKPKAAPAPVLSTTPPPYFTNWSAYHRILRDARDDNGPYRFQPRAFRRQLQDRDTAAMHYRGMPPDASGQVVELPVLEVMAKFQADYEQVQHMYMAATVVIQSRVQQERELAPLDAADAEGENHLTIQALDASLRQATSAAPHLPGFFRFHGSDFIS